MHKNSTAGQMPMSREIPLGQGESGPHLRYQPSPLHAGDRVWLAVAAQLLPLAGLLESREDAVQGVLLKAPGIPGAVQGSMVLLYLHGAVSHNYGREEPGINGKTEAAGRAAGL